MKNLRQLLRRPVRNCESEIRGEFADDGTYVITTTCTHLKKPRIHRIVGEAAQDESFREDVWRRVNGELDTHSRYSDPW